MRKSEMRKSEGKGSKSESFRLPHRAAVKLRRAAMKYLPQSKKFFRAYGYWKGMTNDEVWLEFVVQVMVAGGSQSYESLEASPRDKRLLHYNALRKLTPTNRRKRICAVFRKHKVRYASENPAECRKSKAVVTNLTLFEQTPGGPKGYLRHLCKLPVFDRPDKISADFGYIKLKGSRDLSATLGLAKDVIALDIRILNLLRLAGAKVPREVQSNPAVYKAVHDAIIKQVCKPCGLTGSKLDRILYRSYAHIRADLAATS